MTDKIEIPDFPVEEVGVEELGGDPARTRSHSSDEDPKYAYPLTTWIPAAPKKTAWIIPDQDNMIAVRCKRIWALPFVEKVPLGCNMLYSRIDRRNIAKPTQFQQWVADQIPDKYREPGKPIRWDLRFLVPVIERTGDGIWIHRVAEIQPTAWDEIIKMNGVMSRATKGRVTMENSMIEAYREGDRNFTAEFDSVDVDAATEEADKMSARWSPSDYLKIRAAETEEWLRRAIEEYRTGESAAATQAQTEESAAVDFMAKVSKMRAEDLRSLVDSQGVKPLPSKKAELIDLVLGDQDTYGPLVELF